MAANLPTAKPFVLDDAGAQCAVLRVSVDRANTDAQYTGHLAGGRVCASQRATGCVADVAFDTDCTSNSAA